MQKRSMTTIALSAVVLLIASASYSDEKTSTEAVKPQAQAKCPIMDNDISKKIYVDYQCKRIYLCCEGCIDPVKNDPEKYIKELEAKGIVLEKVKESEDKSSSKEKN